MKNSSIAYSVIFSGIFIIASWFSFQNHKNIDFQFFPLLEEEQYQFNEMELALSRQEIDAEGYFVIDAQLTSALRSGVNAMPAGKEEKMLKRIEALLAVSFPRGKGENIFPLFVKMLHYQKLESKIKKEKTTEKSVFEKILNIQKEVFGQSLAVKLFSNNNALKQYFMTMKEVKNNRKLTKAERRHSITQARNKLSEK